MLRSAKLLRQIWGKTCLWKSEVCTFKQIRHFSSGLSDAEAWLAAPTLDENNLLKYENSGVLSVTSLSGDYRPGKREILEVAPTKAATTMAANEDGIDLNADGQPSMTSLSRRYRRQAQNLRVIKRRVGEALTSFLESKNFVFSSFLAFLNEACDHSLFIYKSNVPLEDLHDEPQYILYFSPGHEAIHPTLVTTMYSILVNEYGLREESKQIPLTGTDDDSMVLIDLGRVAIKFVSRSSRRVQGIELNGQDSRAEQFQFWSEIADFTPTQFHVITRTKNNTERDAFNPDELDSVGLHDFSMSA